jgi:hypothetical protein
MKKYFWTSALLALLLAGCPAGPHKEKEVTFKDDVEFLKKYKSVIILSDETGRSRVALVADWQGRVVTSTADGDRGLSFGWINRELIASGRREEHINVFGGEDRFWLGPEGGQFSIFFQAGDPFDLEHWYVPSAIDWNPFQVVQAEKARAVFRQDLTLKNYSGTEFKLEAGREVRLLTPEQVREHLGIDLGRDIKQTAFETVNTITNTGPLEWKRETGLLSIWILGMFNPSPATTVVIPFEAGPESELGPVVNDAYFGKVPADRLAVAAGTVFFKGDGLLRSKIGISPQRAKSVLGSYDAQHRVLTLVQLTLSPGVSDYVNSMWRIQDNPYGGDVVNSYNDGPAEPGAKPLGPFYELETSSPAAALKPGETLTHIQRTIHLQGPEQDLSRVAQAVLGVGLADISEVFRQQ